MTATDVAVTDVHIAIIGAGFSGLGAAIKLTQNGFTDYLVIDRGADFGGTWRDNTYPGAACDVPSNLYSYSFALNPKWSRTYSHQAEIHRYINDVATRHDIASHTRFRTEVLDARWDEERKSWLIDVETDGVASQVRARLLVGAVGPLCEPNLPDIDGIDGFEGKIVHSARWDHDYDYAGKRIAVIGTGASAIQIVPQVAKIAGHLDVYQRTAPWIVPRTERPYTAVEHAAFRFLPGFQKLSRGAIYTGAEAVAFGMTYAPAALKPVEALCKANIARGTADRALRRAVTPDYRVGCKRILKSNDWYPALDRDNVDLVTDPIASISPRGIVTADGIERDVDVIVVATGFHVTDSPVFSHIVGADGRSLAQVWESAGMQGYKGSTVHGFPNMMLMVGPSTGLGHTSMVYMIESQLNYLVGFAKTVRAQSITRIDVKAEAQAEFNESLQRTLARSVWATGGCASWYKDANGNITTLWPGFTFAFRRITRNFDVAAYDISRALPGTKHTDDAPVAEPATV
ncbi:flavin-containing monooxygenase [Gordonia araii NBRC 100433]|uniref:Flavin-containing monooxygenase n=1 Tax=Gordonia araii NBRC 100433 TaxID=1073574 RepID=G7H6M6_9ACTN|nr:NAD(P)/FAD-dependent oxidoreductase [Gordonia araii]NNG98590.1 NAD(P)/FAD-dependent oxidoreductase [Gordonia araii NBRC 100433]GAB11501.1 flavin-containing monooxygenase [Gordonia araii NBRC 100433]